MQIKPFEELEAIARKRYRAAYASVPEPKVINLEALLEFHGPARRFEVGGLGLRAPPLTFLAGVRLLIAANALKALRESDIAPPGALQRATRDTVRELMHVVRPIRLRDRLRGRWASKLLLAGPEQIERACRYLLYCPDDSSFPPPSKPFTFDFMDAVIAVCAAFSAWVDPVTGFPKRWAMYIYGSRHLSRERARQMLNAADATRAGFGADKKEYGKWQHEYRAVAGG